MPDLFEPVSFAHGPSSSNRVMLSPLTNQQSHADGTLSEEEFRWLVMRAEGGFGITTTCASHVAERGQGFPGQLGCFSDDHLAGLTRLAAAIHERGSRALVQLHHAGLRSPVELVGHSPVAPFDDAETGARALTTGEVEGVVEAFADAARRCQRAGFDGVEIHGAHGYLLCQFLDAERNRRDDRFGGSVENRARIFLEVVEAVRERCGEEFLVAVRLSPERFGVSTAEVVELYRRLVATGEVDLVDLSLWDVFKEAIDADFAGRRLLELFTELDRGTTRLAAAGKLYTGAELRAALEAGLDLVVLGRAAITNHDFPQLLAADPDAAMRALPVSVETLHAEGLSDRFVDYMRGWRGFVAE